MKTVFVLTQEVTGPAGHGEPGTPYLTLKTNGEWYTLGDPAPAFSTKEKAEEYKKEFDEYNFYKITELEVV